MEKLGFEVMHVYGLTETYGHMLQCAWNEEWNELEKDKKNENGQLGLILTKGWGKMFKDLTSVNDEFVQWINAYITEYQL